MKAAKVLLCASFVSFATAQSPAAQYNAVCPGKLAEEEISPGLTVRYTCDTLGDYSSSSLTKGKTMKQCAELCKAAAQCTGSTWDRDTSYCYLSGTSKGKARNGSVFMEEIEEEDPFPVEDEDEDPFPEETCEEAKARLEAEVAQLEQSQANGPSGGSSSSNGPDRYGNQCPGDGNVYTVAGRKWKTTCRASSGQGYVRLGPIMHPMTTTQCIEHCNATPDCNFASSGTVGTCYIYKGSGDFNFQNNYSGYLEV
ncbi:hypothetical protein N7494_000437 [Penicillium frequentans]|uniref:Apple domain-containing protein n=1 Tax=Penicillium frequentans TaxID=3151616 RepID=A0AAD6D5Z1_9EURO|nr:hypothetical protein N7494_000437 [Penicillium glabrum]